ncbi:MAG: glycosyltransferase family A protein [Clostridia bacterium]|nr:glycosyltransferase family A protein [Clostridia bacterium]
MKVSVLIPTYNCGAFLAEALESVLAQTCRDYSITVVDDGSEDDTAGVVSKYPGVRYIRIDHSGVATARNVALQNARGAYIAFLDADDRWEPDKLAKQMDYMNAHPECEIVFTGMRNFTDIPEEGMNHDQREILEKTVSRCLPTALIRKTVFDRCGGFAEELPRGEDTEWILRISRMGVDTTHALGDVLYLRRVHDGNTLLRNPYGQQQTMRFFADIIRKQRLNRVTAEAAEKPAKQRLPFEKLSVVIPVYNGEKYIAEAIGSVRSQCPEAEIVVVDDGSADRSAEIAEACGAVVLRKDNGGAASARNAGAERATGSHLLFLDADDRLTPGAVETLRMAMQGENARAAAGMCVDFVSPDLTEAQAARLLPRKEPYAGSLPGCVLMERGLFTELGGFDAKLRTGETVDFLLKLRMFGEKTAKTDAVTAERRLHLTNTGRTAREDERKSYAAILRERLGGTMKEGGHGR